MIFFKHDGGGPKATRSDGKGDWTGRKQSLTRAIAIATEQKFGSVKRNLTKFSTENGGNLQFAGQGCSKENQKPIEERPYHVWLLKNGWTWNGTQSRIDELPSEGTMIARLSGGFVAVIDNAVLNTHDPRRGGSRMVYGYYSLRTEDKP